MIATEFVPGIVDFDADRVREMSGPFREHGVDIDMASLVYAGERNHVVDYLSTKGWDVEGVTRTQLFKRHGIDVPAPENDDPLGEITSSAAGLPGSGRSKTRRAQPQRVGTAQRTLDVVQDAGNRAAKQRAQRIRQRRGGRLRGGSGPHQVQQ